MPSNLSKKVSSKIESLCAQGCTQINQLLENAGYGEKIEELAEFSHSESKQIIDELAQIMSIYNTGNNDTDDNDAGTGFK